MRTFRNRSLGIGSLLPAFLMALGVVACQEADQYDFGIDEEVLPDEDRFGKADNAGTPGPSVSADTASTAVWEVANQWEDRTTAAARKAGIAWPADSGLNWDEKYALWVQSMGISPGYETYYDSFTLTTPWGKTLPAPRLECAEVAMFLRVTFASWYNLPFYLQAVDSSGKIYFGHMGARNAAGRYKETPNYKTAYKDYTAQLAGKSNDYIQANWPKDSVLRDRAVGDGDTMGFLTGSGAKRGGHYFDEIFLNKRVGHFMRLLLNYFGSVNLASSANTYNLKPQALRAGDILIERWQKQGIGHVLVVKNVTDLEDGKKEANLVSGSMPRRQPKFESGAASKDYFTNEYCGGPGENWDGQLYAALGGGLKRFRVAKNRNGRWTNTWMTADEASWINDTDHVRIAARIAEFEDLLGQVNPTQLRAAYLQMIEDARNHLRQYPASCAARTRREDAFDKLYTLNETQFYLNRAATDSQYRILEDYVFAELTYEQSKTCCWNRTTAAMHQIVMDYNRERQEPSCQDAVVFKALGGGYDLFKQYAQQTGRGHLWVDWSEDEPCPQRDVDNDSEATHEWIPWCEVGSGTTPTPTCTDTYEPNNTPTTAAALSNGAYQGLRICEGDEDYFEIVASGTFTATIRFTHASGDLDLALYQGTEQVSQSQGTGDTEVVTAGAGTYILRVYGYAGAQGEYSLTVAQ
ncbi:MAG: hypothetical protein RBU30_11230 [Polyangia bacterium]|nr:hypothetical protein [Polyangia bacterium]